MKLSTLKKGQNKMNEILTSETLKAVRKHKNMTQAEFAKKLGYSETYIQKLEQGKLPITYEFTRNFKHSLDLELAYRRACNNYCELHEAMNKKPFMTKRGFLCLIILVLIFVLLY